MAQQDGLISSQFRCRQDERRSKPRLRCKGVAEIIVLPIEKRMPGILLDLSINGCCIETAEPLPDIEQPDVEAIFTVNGFTLRLAGVVRNVRNRRRAGIEFIDMTKRKAEQIQELVKDLVLWRHDCAAPQGAAMAKSA